MISENNDNRGELIDLLEAVYIYTSCHHSNKEHQLLKFPLESEFSSVPNAELHLAIDKSTKPTRYTLEIVTDQNACEQSIKHTNDAEETPFEEKLRNFIAYMRGAGYKLPNNWSSVLRS